MNIEEMKRIKSLPHGGFNEHSKRRSLNKSWLISIAKNLFLDYTGYRSRLIFIQIGVAYGKINMG